MISHRGHQSLLALAPTQARLRVRPILYLRRNRAFAADLGARAAVLAAGAALVEWPLIVIGVLLLGWPIWRFVRVRRTLFRGSPLAAKVISVEPPIVACLAEMSRAINASYPLLVVMPADIRFEEHAVESGDRIAVVGLPSGGVPARADSIAVHLVSAVCDAPAGPLLDLVPEWHWDDLDDGLFQVEHPYRAGLYPLG